MITRKQAAAALRLAKAGRLDLDAFVDTLVRDFVTTQAKLERQIFEALLRGDLKTVRIRNQERAKARATLRRLEKRVPQYTPRIARESYRLGERIIRTAAGGKEPQRYGRMRFEAMSLIEVNMRGQLLDSVKTVGRRVDDVFRREGLRAASEAISNDENVSLAAENMRKRLVKQGITSFVDSAGRQWGLENYSRMATRTAVTDAIAIGSQNSMLARGFDLVEIFSGEKACPTCEPYLDKVWSLTGRSDKHPHLKDIPSFHPHCDCVILPSPLAYEERQEFRRAAA